MTPRYDLLRRGLWIMRQLPNERVNLAAWRQHCGTIACLLGHMAMDPVIVRETGLGWRPGRSCGAMHGDRTDPVSPDGQSGGRALAATFYIPLTAAFALTSGSLGAELEDHGTDRAIAIARLTKFLSDAGELHGPIPGVTDTTATVEALKAAMGEAVKSGDLVEGGD